MTSVGVLVASSTAWLGDSVAASRAAQQQKTHAQAVARTAKAMPNAFGLPPFPNDGTQKVGFEFTVQQTAKKAKVSITIPHVVALNYLKLCSSDGIAGDQIFCGNGFVNSTPLLKGVPLIGVPFFGIGNRTFFQSPAGSRRAFGELPPIKVTALAFGSIPVTATLHISQQVRAGVTQPLTIKQWAFSAIPVTLGAKIPGYGTARPIAGQLPEFAYPARMIGYVNVRISNVAVDKVPLNVGANCSAVHSRVRLSSIGGFFSDGPRSALKPGGFNPFFTPSYLSGTTDISRFTGCHDGAENLNPLLTGLISGRGNPILATLTTAYTVWCQGLGSRDCDSLSAAATRAQVSQKARTSYQKLPARLRKAIAAIPH